jgi:putative glutamine amidotransferase
MMELRRHRESRPTIGVPTQTLQVIDDIPMGLPHSWVMNRRYFLALTSVGAIPFMVPLLDHDEDTLRALYDHLDGVFIAGGVDVDPVAYGFERYPLCGRSDPARDHVELLFTRWALADGKPLLGVCRGLQVMNVARGGTLYQDCRDEHPGAIKHDYFPTAGYARDHLAHEVHLVPGSRLHAAFRAETVLVNSMHHQGVKTVGRGLTASAFAPDRLIEALETDDDRFAVGVQWHPEMLLDQDAGGTRRLFEAFIAAALEWRENRTFEPLSL